jgi:tetratricopeptide (TPR) repeat protein
MKDPVGAIPFFETAVQIFPPFPEAHYNLGTSARMACEVPKAVESLRAALRYSQDDDAIAERARKELHFLETTVLKTSPFPNLDAYLANAKLFDEAFKLLNNRDFEKAVQLFRRVLRENPTHVQSFGNLALAYAGLGQRAVAMECFERALALDPGYEPALANRQVVARMREGEPFFPDAIRETRNVSTERGEAPHPRATRKVEEPRLPQGNQTASCADERNHLPAQLRLAEDFGRIRKEGRCFGCGLSFNSCMALFGAWPFAFMTAWRAVILTIARKELCAAKSGSRLVPSRWPSN